MANKNLLESYQQKIAIADGYYAKLHEGQHMDTTKKLVLASCLNNTSKFLNEAMGSGAAQYGAYGVGPNDGMAGLKRFCL